jgi:hypothetical protein
LFLIAAAIGLVFMRLPQTFYQQDEWMGLGRMFAYGWPHEITTGNSFWQVFFAEGRVFARILGILLQKTLVLNTAPMMVLCLLLHLANAFLVFRLTEKLSGDRTAAGLAMGFFAFNAVSHQAVTWLGAAIPSLPSTAFLLLSLCFYHDHVQGKAPRRSLALAVAAMLTSICFKESGLSLFLLFPLMYFLLRRASPQRKDVLGFLRTHALLLAYGAALLLFRLRGLLDQEPISGFIYAGRGDFKTKVFLHMFLYPMTSLGQMLVPPLDFLTFANWFVKHQYAYLLGSPVSGLLVQSAVLDMLSLALSTGLIALLLRSAVRPHEKQLIRFGLAWAAIGFLPYAVLERSYSYLESRYYYGSVPGLGIALAVAALGAWRAGKLWARVFVVSAAALYFGAHATLIRRDIDAQATLSRERRQVIAGLVEIKPFLQKKNVIYIHGSRSYTLPEMPVPFQQGVGYTLMVLYADTGKIPRSFLEGQYLWNMTDDGYREEGDSGFGYYFDEGRLREAVQRHGLGPNNVFSFYYNGERKELTDTTERTRALLGGTPPPARGPEKGA